MAVIVNKEIEYYSRVCTRVCKEKVVRLTTFIFLIFHWDHLSSPNKLL